MTEHCPTCGSPVVIKSSHGGLGITHWYVPASVELLDAARDVLALGYSRSRAMWEARERLAAAVELCKKEEK